ncbi:hypothetical protein NQ317_015064 [Molorchus minor]|uniref:C2H2-type domain-containing protein n=1 Tax=Molorchus minor TaxID=1323400 RepID=A0ABQ9K5E3_9CUCU|nr:hypothetical protein NQ317_015064 [Molorchus minor]
MLSMIPWPGPTVFKISCPRDSARIVRKVVQSKWIPILDKFKVSLPLECPFHPKRDIFGPQQAAKKQHRPSQWTCGICGKSFFEEKYLDMHFDNRHKEYINVAEDAVCLADYCDIMRCDVLLSQDLKSVLPEHENTDIEIWREASSYSKAIAMSTPRHVAKYTFKNGKNPQQLPKSDLQSKKHCQKTEAPEAANKNEDRSSNEEDKSQNSSNNICQNDLVDSALPALNNRLQRIAELQKLKANCKPEELQKIKTKCENLVSDCIASLLIQLSVKDFKEVEVADSNTRKSKNFFSTDDVSVTSASVTDRSTPSPAHFLRHEPIINSDGTHIYTEDYYVASDKENEYIYVTYPPDLKRRLLERFVQLCD